MTNSWPVVVRQVLERLRSTRTRQADLATHLGVSEGHISQLLRASSNPTLSSIERVADALDCEVVVWLLPRDRDGLVVGETVDRLLESGAVSTAAIEVGHSIEKTTGAFRSLRALLKEW